MKKRILGQLTWGISNAILDWNEPGLGQDVAVQVDEPGHELEDLQES